MADRLILALDFGGTKHAAAALRSGDHVWLQRHQAVSPPQSDARSDLEIMEHLVEEVLEGHPPDAIGVSFGGPVDFPTGRVRLSHHVPGWEGIPLREILERRWNAPVVVDNDANTGALGEFHRGAGIGSRSILYITISTGVGGGWILDGLPWRGFASMAGEIGHQTLDPRGPVCLCGKRGCLERYASGRYIADDIRQSLIQSPDLGSVLRELVDGDLSKISARVVAEAAGQGDATAIRRIEEAAWAVGTAIGNCANLMNPEKFILGGGVTGAGQQFWEGIRGQSRRVALPDVEFDIVPAALGKDAPLWGAAILAQGNTG